MSERDPPAPDLQAWLAGLGTGSWVVYGLVAALLVLASLVQPVWRASDPRLALSQAFYDPGDDRDPALERDPWGHPWVLELEQAPYSCGPDGLDQHGGGDDVRVLAPDAWQLRLYEAGPGLLCGLAVLLLGLWEGARALRQHLLGPRTSLRRELLRSGVLALPAAALGGALLVAFSLAGSTRDAARAVWRALEGALLVPLPLPLVLGGSLYLAAFLGLLALRLTRPERDSSAQDSPPSDR